MSSSRPGLSLRFCNLYLVLGGFLKRQLQVVEHVFLPLEPYTSEQKRQQDSAKPSAQALKSSTRRCLFSGAPGVQLDSCTLRRRCADDVQRGEDRRAANPHWFPDRGSKAGRYGPCPYLTSVRMFLDGLSSCDSSRHEAFEHWGFFVCNHFELLSRETVEQEQEQGPFTDYCTTF